MNQFGTQMTLVACLLAGWAPQLSGQGSSPATPAPAAPVAHDPIDGTIWLGSITSPTGLSPYGLAFRRSPRGALFLVEYLPAMHVFSQVVSRVTPRDGGYEFNDLPGSARIDGPKLRGTAFFSRMPFELARGERLPPAADPPLAECPAGPVPRWTRGLGAAVWAPRSGRRLWCGMERST